MYSVGFLVGEFRVLLNYVSHHPKVEERLKENEAKAQLDRETRARGDRFLGRA
jgi:hypothetical protein